MRFRSLLTAGVLCLVALAALPPGSVNAQDTTPPAVREAAITALNQAIPGIGRPNSWRYDILGQTNGSTLGCPLAVGYALDSPVNAYRIWLSYSGVEYLLYVSEDATIVQPCDSKIPGMGSGPMGDGSTTFQIGSCLASPSTGDQTLFSAPDGLGTSSGMSLASMTAPVPVTGRNEASTWIEVGIASTFSLDPYWIPAANVQLTGDCSGIPVSTAYGAAVPQDTTCMIFPGTGDQTFFSAPGGLGSPTGMTLSGTGAPVTVTGRSQDSTWYEVMFNQTFYWIPAANVQKTGDCSAIPVSSRYGGGGGAVAPSVASNCPADYAGYLTPRLAPTIPARVTDGGVPNRVRQQPVTSSPVSFQMNPGTQFTVISGPQCGEGIVWWYVEQNGRQGWTAESQNGSYFVEPLASGPVTPPERPAANVISTLTYKNVVVKQTLDTLSEPSAVAWHPNNTVLAVLTLDGPQLFNYPSLEPITATNQIMTNTRVFDLATAIAFSPDGRYLAVGYTSSTIRLFDLTTQAVIPLLAHTNNVLSLTFNADGSRLASTSGAVLAPGDTSRAPNGELIVWDTQNVATTGQAPILFTLGQSDPVLDAVLGWGIISNHVAAITTTHLLVYDFENNVEAISYTLPVPGTNGTVELASSWLIDSVLGGFLFNQGNALWVFGEPNSGGGFIPPYPVYTQPLPDPITTFAVSHVGMADAFLVLAYGTASANAIWPGPTGGDLVSYMGGISDMAFSLDSTALATVSYDNSTVWIWGIP